MQEREIALDTETTGFKPHEGHRMVEIGAVELVNRIPTGKVYHQYINPQRDMPEGAFAVHGLSEEFLRDFPTFEKVAEDFLTFVGDARLVIHNAKFDMNFINAELTHCKKKNIPDSQVFCTLVHARKKFPGSPASLDALCKRFNIDLSARTKHGALLDAELLADMYLELMGGAQVGLSFSDRSKEGEKSETAEEGAKQIPREAQKQREFTLTEAEEKAHTAFLEHISDPIWNRNAS